MNKKAPPPGLTLEVLSLAGAFPPYILSVRFTPDGGLPEVRHFTIEDPITLPVSERSLLEKYVIPRI